eukprot:TRINITY_DN25067_c0_g1_i1.p1 TRINITY_DN25067_c0_g1~~TRINITY_DN25067_c0_g1_i1.p1  ORF type:complete len:275 (+),score=36.79 TRINITY_DN25067_c0_g1_i1:46-870(+)
MATASGCKGLQPQLWFTELAPRLGAASVVVAAITIERTISQVVNTSGGLLQPLSHASAWRLFSRTIGKQTGIVFVQYTGTREMRLAFDRILQPAPATMLACGICGVPFSSIQYNWAIQDTYRHCKIDPPAVSGLLGFLRQKLAPGLPWAFLRAGVGTGSALYYGPFMTARIHSATEGRLSTQLSSLLAGLSCGAVASLGTQSVHNLTLIAGRMAALGVQQQAPHYTIVALAQARKEMGLKLFYANFQQRMVINAVSVAVLNVCNIFHRPELSGW